MLQTIINAIVPVAITALIGVLVAIIKALGDAGVSFIQQKKAALEVKIGADTYAQNLAFAKATWAIVDEKFRITPTLEKTFEAKQAEFTAQIKKMIPEITDAEIEQLRQAVAGEVNKGKAVVATTVTDTVQTPTV
jgi:hypothetical protein